MAKYKVSAIAATPQRMGEAVAALTALHFQTTITEIVGDPVIGSGNGKTTQRPAPVAIPRNLPVRKARPSWSRIPGGAKPSQTPRGKVILSVLNGRRVATFSDIQTAITKAGFAKVGNLLVDLTKEGRVIKEARGIYRIPSTIESLRQQQAQDPTFKG